MGNVAILIDAGYYKSCYRSIKSKPITNPQHIINHCTKLLNDESIFDEKLLRIYYYDCEPFSGEHQSFDDSIIDYGITTEYKTNEEFQNKLKHMDDIAFRKGLLQLNGWKIKNHQIKKMYTSNKIPEKKQIKPDFKQKRIDIKIGLDIAWLASKKLVTTLVLITGDTDFIPAMKFARREGVRVVINSLKREISLSLKEHSDKVIKLSPLMH